MNHTLAFILVDRLIQKESYNSYLISVFRFHNWWTRFNLHVCHFTPFWLGCNRFSKPQL